MIRESNKSTDNRLRSLIFALPFVLISSVIILFSYYYDSLIEYSEYSIIIITTLNVVVSFIVFYKIFNQRFKDQLKADNVIYNKTRRLDGKDKRFFIELRARWSTEVQALIFSFISIAVGTYGVYSLLNQFFLPKYHLLILVNIIIFFIYSSWYFWTFFIVKRRIQDLIDIQDFLLDDSNKNK